MHLAASAVVRNCIALIYLADFFMNFSALDLLYCLGILCMCSMQPMKD